MTAEPIIVDTLPMVPMAPPFARAFRPVRAGDRVTLPCPTCDEAGMIYPDPDWPDPEPCPTCNRYDYDTNGQVTAFVDRIESLEAPSVRRSPGQRIEVIWHQVGFAIWPVDGWEAAG